MRARDIKGGGSVCLIVLMVCALATGCVFDSLAWSGDDAFSHGPSRFGSVHNAVHLDSRGDGYVVPPRWSTRGLNYGSSELVALVVHAGRQLAMDKRTLSVGDMSREHGGPSPWHRSHQTGRDVDLLFLMVDGAGKAIVNDSMDKLSGDGSLQSGSQERRFDVVGNWLLVRALLENPIAEVQYIFVQDDLKHLLLDEGQRAGATVSLLARASEVMMQPGDSAPHDDHFHVRVFCSKEDRDAGCVDFGRLRWFKKSYKYEHRIERKELGFELPPVPLHM